MISKARFYYINSDTATSGVAGNFTYNLKLDAPYTHCVVTQASFPISYYIVRDGSNTFILQESTQSVIIIVPAGNYTALSFQTVLQNLLNTNSPNSFTYSVIFPNQFSSTSTLKYTFTVTNNGSIQPIFAFPATSLLYQEFGFPANSSNQFSSDSLTSINVISFVPESTLFIHSDICENYQDDILQEIYNGNSVPGAYCVYQLTTSPETYAKRVTNTNSNLAHFYITDEAGNIIDFNGLNILITLMMFTKDNSLDILKKYIQYTVNNELQQTE